MTFFFDLHITKFFSSDDLPINMVLNTPSGEERIREYQVKVKNKDGSLCWKVFNRYLFY